MLFADGSAEVLPQITSAVISSEDYVISLQFDVRLLPFIQSLELIYHPVGNETVMMVTSVNGSLYATGNATVNVPRTFLETESVNFYMNTTIGGRTYMARNRVIGSSMVIPYVCPCSVRLVYVWALDCMLPCDRVFNTRV